MGRGHREPNHPVRDLATGKVENTSQKHGFVVVPESLPADLETTHLSLFDGTIEGLRSTTRRAFSVQYHPEASPGPHDSHYLFDRFIEMIDGRSEEHTSELQSLMSISNAVFCLKKKQMSGQYSYTH